METQVKQADELKGDIGHHKRTITISVEVNGKDKEIEFDHSPVTGAEIRAKAGVPNSDDLTRLAHGSRELMDPQEMDRISTQLTTVYGDSVKVGQDGHRRLVQIDR